MPTLVRGKLTLVPLQVSDVFFNAACSLALIIELFLLCPELLLHLLLKHFCFVQCLRMKRIDSACLCHWQGSSIHSTEYQIA